MQQITQVWTSLNYLLSNFLYQLQRPLLSMWQFLVAVKKIYSSYDVGKRIYLLPISTYLLCYGNTYLDTYLLWYGNIYLGIYLLWIGNTYLGT